jgi:cytochrome c553
MKVERLLLCAALALANIGIAVGDPLPVIQAPTPAPPPPPQQPPNPADLLQWDAMLKEKVTKPGDATADFSFSVSNPTESNIIIDHVQTSCGCTTAKLPSQPWILAPHTGGSIGVSVNLAGKSGTFFKTLTVFFPNNAPQKQLAVKVTIPDSPETARFRNQQMASADRQMVFRNDCASCHAEPAKDKMGRELYTAACGICHDAAQRATMVPNLHALNHPTNHDYWKQWITAGKLGSMMPAFSTKMGGPLSDEQIESLAAYLAASIPSAPGNVPPPPASPAPQAAAQPAAVVVSPPVSAH